MNQTSVTQSHVSAPSQVVIRGLISFLITIGVAFGAPDTPASHGQESAAISNRLGQAIDTLRSGQKMSAAEQARNQDSFERQERLLRQKHSVADNFQFPEPDRTDFYLNAIKMSLLDPELHGGWAFRSALSQAVRLELLHRLDRQYDPFLAFCAIFPALKRGETEYAVGAYEALASSDPFLAGKVIEWSAEYLGQLDWLAAHYLKAGQSGKVRQIATDARRLGTDKALVAAGSLFERMGDYAEAEVVLRQVKDEQRRIDAVTALYSRHPRDVDANGVSFQQHCDALRDSLFAKGLEKVVLSGLTAPPLSGVTFTKDNGNLRALGMRVGDVIVAVDGYRIERFLQYLFVRNLDIANDRMALIVWNGKNYSEVDAWVKDRRLGAPTEDYTP